MTRLIGVVACVIVGLASASLAQQDVKNLTNVAQPAKVFGIQEIILAPPAAMLNGKNPYQDFVLSAEVKPAEGEQPAAKLTGFYYGNGQFHVRFMPPAEGSYTYTAKLAKADGTAIGAASGQFKAVKGDLRGPAKINKDNPIWFEDGHGKPLFLSGAWSHASLDINVISNSGGAKWGDASAANFNTFADNAEKNGYLDKSGLATKKYLDAIDVWLDGLAAAKINWIVITADHMGWGFQTASNWKGLRAGSFNDPWSYNANSGLTWDYALAHAAERGIYVKMNLQEWCQGKYGQHPFQQIPGVDLTSTIEHPDDIVTNEKANAAWMAWVKYLASRYGAFSNVMFQMGNEPPGDGCKLGPKKWGEFDTATQETLRAAAGRPVIYSSGAPVGGGVHQGDLYTYHPTAKVFAASGYYMQASKRPFHNEEILAYNAKNLEGWVAGSRYVKFASFIGGGHGSALVFWNWKPAMDDYKKSSVSVHAFIAPVLDDLFALKPDSSFIQEAPAEFAKGLCSQKHWLVYMQKTDPLAKEHAAPAATLTLKLPDGDVTVNWFDPLAGKYLPAQNATVKDGTLKLTPPADFKDDFALRVSKK